MSQMTKRALVASLKDLLAEKPLDKITVTDLTEHCGVNRMTFYYHFKDIYDLVEWAAVTPSSSRSSRRAEPTNSAPAGMCPAEEIS